MQPTILQALASLDVAVEENWTTEGLPRLDVLKDLTGQQVTRVALQGLAPGFNRANPVLPKAVEKPEPVVPTQEPVESQEPDANEEQEGEGEGEVRELSLEEHIKALEEERGKAQAEVSQATVELNKIVKKLDALYHERDKQTTENARELAANTIAQYQAAQLKARLARKG